MNQSKQTNRLINEKSPYLLQHATNPIDWYAWSEEAFDRAMKEDKPIFLSIGYSTCHWCHVMARESFQDDEVASLLNEHFIAIKVDREERPDVDTIYMDVCQAMNEHAGWPLTIIMTPDKIPFFASTYIPRNGNHHRHGLIELLTIVETKWQVKRSDLLYTANKIQEYYQYKEDQPTSMPLDETILDYAYKQLTKQYDNVNGGFGDAPKFPMPHYYFFLIRYHIMRKNDHALKMVTTSLTTMAKGGIYDQIGFGFSRYSVDKEWLVPHFEKMLIDNAWLTHLYIEAYLHTYDDFYAKIAKEILSFVEDSLRLPHGGFATAIDADSNGIEGDYYLWSWKELKATLTSDELNTIKSYYNLSEFGQFDDKNILNLLHFTTNESIIETPFIQSIKSKLFKARQKRTHPHIDDKVLTGYNAKMIHSFTRAYLAFDNELYLEIAEQAMNFILTHLISADGRLLARYRDKEAKYHAYSEDYAHLITALLDLFLATNNLHYLDKTLFYTKQMIDLFYDAKTFGFYQTAHDAEKLLFRNKEIYDGATPSTNAIMALNFIRLAEITDETAYEDLAIKQFEAFGQSIQKTPTATMYFLTAYLMYRVPKRKIVLITEEINDDVKELQHIVRNRCIPCTEMITLLKEDILEHDLFSYYIEDEPIALYICENYMCLDPIYEIDQMKEALDKLILLTLN